MEAATSSPLRVVCGLFWRDGRVLVQQRRHDAVMPLKWEFPGGKVEPGETLSAALAREAEEELGVQASVGELAWHTPPASVELPSGAIMLELFFFWASMAPNAAPQPHVAEEVRWLTPAELSGLSFCPGDQPLIEALQQERLRAPW